MDSEPRPGQPQPPPPRSPAASGQDAVGLPTGERRAKDLVKQEFSVFYRPALPALVAYLKYLDPRARAEEATECAQAALVEALQNWESIKKPMAWCRQVASRMYWRRRFDAVESFDEVPANATPILSSHDADHFDSAIEEICNVYPLLGQLSLAERQVMALTVFFNEKPKDIAEELDMKPEQVRSTLYRARAKLRRIVNRDRDREGGC